MILVFQFLTVLLVSAGPVPLAWAVATRAGDRPLAERWTLLLLTWCVVQMTLGILLGLAGGLRPAAVAAAEVVLLVLGGAFLRGRPRAPMTTRASGPEAGLLFALATLGLTALHHLLREPTTNMDSLVYHLPQIALWVQDGRLSLLDRFDQIARYPFGWEVVGALFTLARHDVMLAAAPNLVVWAMTGSGVIALARRLGATREGALLAAVLVLSVPDVVRRLSAIQVDLALAAFFLAALLFGARAVRSRGPIDVVAAVAALGGILAVKLSGFAYVGVVAVVLGFEQVRGRRDPRPRWPWRAIAAGLVILSCTGGFWYLRNLLDLGNPFGYLQVEFGGKVLFEGTRGVQEYQRTSLASMFHLGSAHDWRVFGGVLRRGLGWPALALLAFALLSPAVAVRHAKLRWSLILAWSLLLVTVWLYWRSPYTATNENQGGQISPWVINGLRYGLPALVMLAVLAAAGCRVLARLRWPLAAVGMAATLWAARAEGIAVAGAILAGLVIGAWIWRWRRVGRPAVMTAAAVATLVAMHLAEPHRERRREELFGETYVYLRDQVPEHATFGILTSAQGFLLHGPRLTRRVVSVLDRATDRETYLQLLRDEGIDYVASGPLPRSRTQWRGRRERSWMSVRDQRFAHVFGSNVLGQMYIYRFDDSP